MEKELEKLYEELKKLVDDDSTREMIDELKEKNNNKNKEIRNSEKTYTLEDKKRVYRKRKERIKTAVQDIIDNSEIVFVGMGDSGVATSGSIGDIIKLIGMLINELLTEYNIPKEILFDRIEEELED